MTEDEWSQSPPAQAESYLDAWTNKQKREDYRIAATQLIIAQSADIKINGRRPRLKDFLPEYAKPDSQEEGMAEIARELAKQKRNV